MKPCPFCGGSDIRYYASTFGRRFKCMYCHAEGPPAPPELRGNSSKETEELRTKEVTINWNRRAND